MKTLLLSILGWSVAALLAGRWFSSKLSPRTTKLVYIFIAYIWVIGAFSNLYHFVYSNDHSTFSFASDVLKTRKNDVLAERKKQLEHLKVKLDAVIQLYDTLGQNQVRINVDP